MFYITFSFTVVAIFILMFNLVNSTDYFLIDWEKEKDLGKFEINKNRKEVSVWRKVLLVNELYELSVSRTINIELVSLLSVLFLCGLNWINLNSMLPNTTLINDTNISTSPILSYFIITFVILAIALLQFRKSLTIQLSGMLSKHGTLSQFKTLSTSAASLIFQFSSSMKHFMATTSMV